MLLFTPLLLFHLFSSLNIIIFCQTILRTLLIFIDLQVFKKKTLNDSNPDLHFRALFMISDLKTEVKI